MGKVAAWSWTGATVTGGTVKGMVLVQFLGVAVRAGWVFRQQLFFDWGWHLRHVCVVAGAACEQEAEQAAENELGGWKDLCLQGWLPS